MAIAFLGVTHAVLAAEPVDGGAAVFPRTVPRAMPRLIALWVSASPGAGLGDSPLARRARQGPVLFLDDRFQLRDALPGGLGIEPFDASDFRL